MVDFSSREVSLPYIKWKVTWTAAQRGFGLVTGAAKSYLPFPRSSAVASSVTSFFGASSFWSWPDTRGADMPLMLRTVRVVENEYVVNMTTNAMSSSTSATSIDIAHHVRSWSRCTANQ